LGDQIRRYCLKWVRRWSSSLISDFVTRLVNANRQGPASFTIPGFRPRALSPVAPILALDQRGRHFTCGYKTGKRLGSLSNAPTSPPTASFQKWNSVARLGEDGTARVWEVTPNIPCTLQVSIVAGTEPFLLTFQCQPDGTTRFHPQDGGGSGTLRAGQSLYLLNTRPCHRQRIQW